MVSPAFPKDPDKLNIDPETPIDSDVVRGPSPKSDGGASKELLLPDLPAKVALEVELLATPVDKLAEIGRAYLFKGWPFAGSTHPR
jgi:hypothetical protein